MLIAIGVLVFCVLGFLSVLSFANRHPGPYQENLYILVKVFLLVGTLTTGGLIAEFGIWLFL